MKTQYPEPAIRVRVDPTNPGQFFACCGLLELAHRLWDGAEGWFSVDQKTFLIISSGGQGSDAAQIIARLVQTGLDGELSPKLRKEQEGLENKKRALKKENKELTTDEETRRKELGRMQREGYIVVSQPFNLRLDWWADDTEDTVKTWAGRQEVLRIARAALASLPVAFASEAPFDYSCVMKAVEDEAETNEQPDRKPRRASGLKAGNEEDVKDKAEPFYFDVRRGSNALAIDIGFMPDSLKMRTVAYPAVDLLCLVGLQRFRPVRTDKKRVFDYFTWTLPLAAHIAPLAACGLLAAVGGRGLRFEVVFRTDQRKHKAFTPAIPIERRERAATWSTVTPVVLPGYDDPAHYRRRLKSGVDAEEQKRLLERLSDRMDSLLSKAIVQAGFSEELAKYADLEWRKVGFWPGTDLADRYGVPDHLRRFPRVHVRLRWRDAQKRPVSIPGPVCLGGGRFYGLGLFAAE